MQVVNFVVAHYQFFGFLFATVAAVLIYKFFGESKSEYDKKDFGRKIIIGYVSFIVIFFGGSYLLSGSSNKNIANDLPKVQQTEQNNVPAQKTENEL